MSDTLDWKVRFTAPRVARLAWAADAPDRLGLVSNEAGSWQAWALDLATGDRRQVSRSTVGAEEVHMLPDGSGVVWWDDATGSERGRWMVTPFEGSKPTPQIPEQPDGCASGLSMVPGGIAVGLAGDDEMYRVFVSVDGEPPRQLYEHSQPAGVGDEWPQGRGGLSADAALVAIRHSEHGDIERTAIRVLETATGATVGDMEDEGSRLLPVAWSPAASRLLFLHERHGWEAPGLWDLSTGTATELDTGLDGAVFPEGWFPDGKHALIRHSFEGADRLLKLNVDTGDLQTLLDEGGTVDAAAARPDGDVWMLTHTSARPPHWVNLAGDEVVALPGPRQPDGRRFQPRFVQGPAGRLQAFVVTPGGRPPFPTIVSVHGGPNWHHTDGYDAGTQAYVDHGYAVLLVNYRGSTGYGVAFRDSLRGNIGFPESEDVNAALDLMIEEGIADPGRVYLEGWSWGGYQATLNAGLRAERWRAVVAGIPVGDYVACHYECSPPLRAWDLAVMGGSPMDLPELYAERNPMTYVDRVQAPMLMIAGEHDSRCPLGQVMTYAHALRSRGKHVEVHLYPGGHHANDMAEQVRHVEMVMEFFSRYALARAGSQTSTVTPSGLMSIRPPTE